jgi:hypothetical protein
VRACYGPACRSWSNVACAPIGRSTTVGMPTPRCPPPDFGSQTRRTSPGGSRPVSRTWRSAARSGARVALRLLDRLSVHSRCPLVAYHLEQRLCQIGRRRHRFEQPTGVRHTGDGSCRFLGLRRMQHRFPRRPSNLSLTASITASSTTSTRSCKPSVSRGRDCRVMTTRAGITSVGRQPSATVSTSALKKR